MASRDEALKELARRELERRRSQPSVAGDVAKSGASGFARGAADLAGTPGLFKAAADAGPSIGEFGRSIMPDWMAPAFDVQDRALSAVRGVTDYIPGGADIRQGMSSITGGATDYQPQTTAGEYARTAGEFAPAALMGPGGAVRKAAMTTIPALASETAGQITEGTALEPYARAGAAVAGGVASAGRVNPAREAARGAPSRETLKAQADKLYEGLRKAGIKYDANAFTSTIQGARDELLKKGLRPVGPVKEAFDYLDEFARGAGLSPDFDDINNMVTAVGRSARSAQDGNARLAFNLIRDKLDDFERAAPLITSQPIQPNLLNRVRDTARQTALKNIKAREIENVVKNADTYQSGVEAGIRNGISNLVRSKKGQQLFTGPERTALLQVAQGRKGLRTLSRFGFDLTSLSGNASFLPTLGAVGAGTMVNPLSGAGLAAAGTAAKVASPVLTQRALDQASAAIRSGRLNSPAGIQATQQLRNEQALRRLLGLRMGQQGAHIGAD